MAEEVKEITLESAKRTRLYFRLAFAVIAWLIPVVITLVKFDLFRSYATYKLAFLAVLVLLVIVWKMKKRIVEWINTWENSNMFKHILIGTSRVFPFILVLVIMALCKQTLKGSIEPFNNMMFCLEWTALCELIAYVAIYPFEMKYDNIVQRMLRKNERKEDYKEAIKEMNEGK